MAARVIEQGDLTVRLDWFWIGDYKNLKDVTVDFDQTQWVTVVIGWNGTGKSNVLEALATLFRDLVMGENLAGTKNHPTFPYKLRYECRGKWIYIDSDPRREKDVYAIRVADQEEQAEPSTIQADLGFNEQTELDPAKLGEQISITQFLKLKFPVLYYATRSITVPMSGFRWALPGISQSIPKPCPPRSLARARRRSANAYSVRLAVA